MKLQRHTVQLLIIAVSALLFIPFLGGVHLFDWDEINFAESAREMIVSHDYLTVKINFLPFWEKPPLFIWFQVLSMKVFGINEFAARFPNAICGIITLLVLFNIGRKLSGEKFGLYWVLAYAGSVLPFFYFKSGIIDPWFNLFIFLGINFFIPYWKQETKFRIPKLLLSAVFIGLGIMTKGPVALLIFGLCVFIYWAMSRFQLKVNLFHLLLFLLVLALVGGFWFLLQIVSGHFDLVRDFFVYQVRLFQTKDAGHGGFLLYHFVVLFLGVFPASIIALKSFGSNADEGEDRKIYVRWMKVLFWVVLILFTIVKTKIVHYSSLCYFPLTFLAAYALYRMDIKKEILSTWQKAIMIVISVFYLLAIAALPVIDHYKASIIQSGIIADVFAMGNLQAIVHWTGFEFAIGLVLLVGIILFVLYYKGNFTKALWSLFACTVAYTIMAAVWLTPRIESYSQRAAIEYFQSLQGKSCYVETLGYKSYAHLFYSRKPMPVSAVYLNKDTLLVGKIDRDAYFSAKINKKKEIQENYPELKVLYEKNGFVFFIRKAKQD
jgi:4-amino-4-deoxy-L-arabinose transferase-like glycosyltransferase